LTSLVKKLDQAAQDSGKAGAFVVLLTDDDKMEDKLKELAEKEGLKKVVLTIDGPQGPPKMKIAKDADVTVLLYEKKRVEKNFAYEKGKFSEQEAEKVADAYKGMAQK
jgi:L-lactate utilization protein LutC